MIQLLRRKFLLVAMLSLLGTMVVLCTAIGAWNFSAAAGRADRAIELLYQNGGEFPRPEKPADPALEFDFQVTWETPYQTRYFIVRLTGAQEVQSVELEHIAALDRQSVVDTVDQIIASGLEQGYEGYYRFGVFPEEDGGSTVIGVDCFLQLQSAYHMIRIIVAVFLACAAMVFILLVLLSKRAIRPFVENLKRQRQFVTDASHELKTPLAILSADLGLLEDSGQQSKWLDSARQQVVRLDRLIKNLVELSCTEESIPQASLAPCAISEVAQANADAFQPLAEAAGKRLESEITPGLFLTGVQDNLFRLLSILLDNAVKYCDPGGTIRLTLTRRGRSVCIQVSNPCADLDPTQLSRYFDRFYRADSSRARATGGYGIGLSTALAIVTRHHGRITNHYENGVITFQVLLPQQAKKGRPGS